MKRIVCSPGCAARVVQHSSRAQSALVAPRSVWVRDMIHLLPKKPDGESSEG
jgi:hypothetical protein